LALPATPGGVVQVASVKLTTDLLAHATPPTVMLLMTKNDDPVSVIVVPPAVGPRAGEMAVKSGAST
jgi:hypothetical protein